MKAITLTFAAFAHDLGAATRITLDASEGWHREYTKADAATRTARREEFISNFLIGYIGQDKKLTAEQVEKRAKKILAQSRDERSTSDQKVYDAARAKFTYHVVRPEKKSSGKADIVAQALKLIAQMDAAQKRKVLAAL
jgi:hypothetical protein